MYLLAVAIKETVQMWELLRPVQFLLRRVLESVTVTPVSNVL